MGIDIFDASDSGADDLDLSHIEIDTNYARRLEHNKKREALDRLKDLEKQGRAGASDNDSSASSDDDDDDAVVASTKEELEFIRALNIIKKKDPILKQPDVRLFNNDSNDVDAPRRVRRDKPLYLKDVNAQHLLEEGPEFEETPLKHDSKIYKEEQADSIRAFLEAEKAALEGGEDDDFIKQKETVGEDESADADAEIEQELDNFFGKDVEIDEGDKFLKQYLRERKWIDREKEKKVSFDVDVSEDENELERQDKYEASYNFRYQAPDQTDRVLGHSRVMEGSVRKKSSSRAVQRKSKEERMAQAEFERREELKHLKNLKKKEIQEKLERVRAIAGIGEGGVCKLDEDDLEEDFDPEEYDRKMREMFDDDYYGENADLEKPDFDNEDELLGFPDGLDDGGSKEGFAAARERFLKQEEEEHEEEPSDRKRKGKVSLKEKVALEKELEEYYKLDYEDTIGDLKTRFKYKAVEANRFGLDPEEILLADDKNLNQYVSVKKLAPYREQEWETTYHQKKRKHEILQLDQVKISKKHDQSGGQRSSQAERKHDNDQSGLSKRSKRRRRQNELKPSWTRLVAFGKRAAKSQKKH